MLSLLFCLVLGQVHVYEPEDEKEEDLVGRCREVLPQTPESVPVPLERSSRHYRQTDGRDIPVRPGVRGVCDRGRAGARDGIVRTKMLLQAGSRMVLHVYTVVLPGTSMC